MEYEKDRLTVGGYLDLVDRDTQVSKINNAFGYDKKSAKGNYAGNQPADDVYIEVKTIASFSKNVLYLTRHEYEAALNHSNYLFYLWNSIFTFSKTLKPRVLQLRDIENCMPTDSQDGSGKGTECQTRYQSEN